MMNQWLYHTMGMWHRACPDALFVFQGKTQWRKEMKNTVDNEYNHLHRGNPPIMRGVAQ